MKLSTVPPTSKMPIHKEKPKEVKIHQALGLIETWLELASRRKSKKAAKRKLDKVLSRR
jgi:hypothetical protein